MGSRWSCPVALSTSRRSHPNSRRSSPVWYEEEVSSLVDLPKVLAKGRVMHRQATGKLTPQTWLGWHPYNQICRRPLLEQETHLSVASFPLPHFFFPCPWFLKLSGGWNHESGANLPAWPCWGDI